MIKAYSGGGDELNADQFFAVVNQELELNGVSREDSDRLFHFVDDKYHAAILKIEFSNLGNGLVDASELVWASEILAVGGLDKYEKTKGLWPKGPRTLTN